VKVKIPLLIILVSLLFLVLYIARVSSIPSVNGGGDPLSMHDSGSRSGSDHNIPWTIYSQVWGWYFRGDNYFFASDHHGEAFGGVRNYWWG